LAVHSYDKLSDNIGSLYLCVTLKCKTKVLHQTLNPSV